MHPEPAFFEQHKIRRIFDGATETWWFSVVDIIQVLVQQLDYQTARKYWNKLKERLKDEGSESVTNCHQLKMVAEDGKQRLVKAHKGLKGLNTQNLRGHMTEAELLFTALAELSTRQIAESMDATGRDENERAAVAGGGIARKARQELESRTGKSVVSPDNVLPPQKRRKSLASPVQKGYKVE